MVTRKSLPAKGTECKESGSDIKAIYQILHFNLRKQRKKKSHLLRKTKQNFKSMENYIQKSTPLPLKFSPPPLFQGTPLPPLI